MGETGCQGVGSVTLTGVRSKHQEQWVIALAICFAVGLNLFVRKSIFTEGETDGFYVQVSVVYRMLITGQGALEPLQWIHALRLLVVYPFFIGTFAKLPPIFDSLLMAIYCWPIVAARFRGKFHPVQLIALVLPYALSYRGALLAVGFAYLYIFMFSDRRNPWLLALSMLLSFLSSGVVLSWLIIALICYRQSVGQTRVGGPLVVFSAAGFGLSLLNKIEFFSASRVSNASSGGVQGALERSTIWVSFVFGQTARFMTYLAMISLAAWYIWQIFTTPRIPRTLLYFFIASVPGFAMEGLAAMAYVLPFAFAICGLYVLEGADSTPQVQSA